MPIFHKINPSFVVWEVKESLPELLSLLPASVQCPSFKAESRKLEWAAAHVLVQEITGKFQLIKHLHTGAPFLDGDARHLSISHTRNFVSVCLSDVPVGIDVEMITPRANKLRSRFMSPSEGFLEDGYADVEATLLWSAKESLFKILEEQDAVDFLQHLHTQAVPFSEEGIIPAQEKRTPYQKMYEVHYRIFPDFVLTWALIKQ